MRIAVTGAAGHVGPFVLDELLAHGHEPVAIDLRAGGDERVRWVVADVEDVDALAAAFAGCPAVVHLAAIRAPGLAPPEVTFRVNTHGTICALEAAVGAGASRFVLASSDSALGFCFRTRDDAPDYLPLDEEHPARPQDCYGVSKLAAEEVCRSYARRGAISTICLRTCDVWFRGRPDALEVLRDERREQRALWVYAHARDVARAYRLACEAEGIEHETLFISARDAETVRPTAELLREFYPGVPLRAPLSGHAAVVSGARARERLGFVPELSWRDEVDPGSLA
jgi:nucleoside-diphosphate-sugar epimerase